MTDETNREIGYLWVPLVRNALYEHKIKYSLNAYIGSFVLENCITVNYVLSC